MNDLDNEKEWRRIIYTELKELRKDLQGFKIRMITLILGLTAAANTIGFYLTK